MPFCKTSVESGEHETRLQADRGRSVTGRNMEQINSSDNSQAYGLEDYWAGKNNMCMLVDLATKKCGSFCRQRNETSTIGRFNLHGDDAVDALLLKKNGGRA